MKYLVIAFVGALCAATFSSCTTVVEKKPQTASTTTTEETVQRPGQHPDYDRRDPQQLLEGISQ